MEPSLSDFPPRNFIGLYGGLRTIIKPNNKVHLTQVKREVLEHENHCRMFHEYEVLYWEMEGTRRHFRIRNSNSIEFYPAFYAHPQLHHKLTQYEWNIHVNQYKPDTKYLNEFNKALTNHLNHAKSSMRKGEVAQLDNFTLSQGLFNINWLGSGTKRELCIYIAQFLCHQCSLKNIIVECAQMRDQEGFRILLTFALAVGDTLEMLCLYNYFLKGVMPVNIGYKEHMNDPFIMTSDLKKPILETEKKRIWCQYIMDNSGSDLPTEEYFYFLTLSLKLFTNLTKLYVNYNWLSIGQGIGLNSLGCIKNGQLRDLYLLCTKEDMPYNCGSRISTKAWLKAVGKCPNLKVHLALMSVGSSYDDNITVLVDGMPLTSYYLVTGLPIVEMRKFKQQYFDCLIKSVIHKYNQSLRNLYIETWYVRERMDVILSRCITDLPLLENLTYSANIDKFDTLIEVCEYLLNYPSNMKYFKVMLIEDGCHSENYKVKAEEIEENYKYQLADRGIEFHLETRII